MKKTDIQQAIDDFHAADPEANAAIAITVSQCGEGHGSAHLYSTGSKEAIITALAKFIASDPDISLLVREALGHSISYLNLPKPGNAAS